MKTRIDAILSDYMNSLLESNMIDFINVKILMNAARQAFGLDAVFFMENNHYMYSLTNTYLSADHMEEWNLDAIHLKEDEYQYLLNLYGESGLSEELYLLPVDTGSMLHCGMISKDYFYLFYENQGYTMEGQMKEKADYLQKENMELRKQAETDGLTGLMNRYAYEKKMLTMMSNSSHMAFLLIDIDYFKQVND